MRKSYQGLPAAADIQQSILLAQLQILRDLERARRTSAERPVVTEPATDSVALASWSPAVEWEDETQ